MLMPTLHRGMKYIYKLLNCIDIRIYCQCFWSCLPIIYIIIVNFSFAFEIGKIRLLKLSLSTKYWKLNFTEMSILVCLFEQGDYIKHPVLYELSHKYGFTDNLPESALPNRLEEIKEAIRREIRKELKVTTFRSFNYTLSS